MDVLLALQQRLSNRLVLRIVLSVLFVFAATVGGACLGQRRWSDVHLAQQRLASVLHTDGTGTLSGVDYAEVVLFIAACAACAVLVPLLAVPLSALATGRWPRAAAAAKARCTRHRAERWTALTSRALSAQANGAQQDAAVSQARAQRIAAYRPNSPTWCGDRFGAAEQRIRVRTGLEIASAWTWLLQVIPRDAKDDLERTAAQFDSACEAMGWAVVFTALGAWWWPAAMVGLAAGFGVWRRQRRAAAVLSDLAEAVAAMYDGALADAVRVEREKGATRQAIGEAVMRLIHATWD